MLKKRVIPMMTSFNEAINFVNLNKICRICLSETENMKSVFSKLSKTEILEADTCSLSDILAKTTSVDVSFK